MGKINATRETIAVDVVARNQLQTIVAEPTEGVVIVENDGRTSWADDAALAMHDATPHTDLGATMRSPV